MANAWYYAHDETKSGPFSGQQLKDLAASGALLPKDTVWKDGVEEGVLASRVKNLFPAPPVEASPDELRTEESVAAARPGDSAQAALVPTEKPAVRKEAPRTEPKPLNRGRAVALSNADIVSQDGTQARYRKKCKECGHVDSACHAITITNKTTKSNFYCPKCRRVREVAIQCSTR